MLGNDLVYWTLTKTARRQLADAFYARPELRKELSAAEDTFFANLIGGFLSASARLAGVNNEGAAVSPHQKYDLGSISAPILIIHAADDHINPPEVAEAPPTQIPNARRIAYPNGGHLLLCQHREIQGAEQQLLALSRDPKTTDHSLKIDSANATTIQFRSTEYDLVLT